MHTQDFVIDEGCNRHAVENILKFFPKSDAISVFTLIIEAVNTVDLPALVVTSQEEEVFLKLNFVGQQ